jgi:type II secretory pathway pseudopilin PulG
MPRNAPRSPARAEFRAEIRTGRARVRRIRAPRRQRGFVLVLVLTLIVAAALWGITTSLVTAAKRTDRSRATMAAIMQAKDALIGYAARGALVTPPPAIDRPGSLPCPATTTGGTAGIACTAFGPPQPNAMVGRFPWRTLELPELRDATGEPLWYAMSPDFRRVNGLVVNSETQGQLELVGLAPAQRVVAVIIAPGAPLGAQNRDPSVPANLTNVANYLEGENNYLDPAYDNGMNNYRFTNATASGTFNDIVIPITEEELFAAVENMVALRLRNDVKPYIDLMYRDVWHAYPFPAAFDPSTAAPPGYVGVVGTTEGQLPSSDVSALTFPLTSIAVTGPIADFASAPPCSVIAPGDEARCTANLLNPNAVLTVELAASNVGRSFAEWDETLVTVDESPGLPNNPATIVGTPVRSVDASGNGKVTVSVRLGTPGITYTVHFPRPQPNATLATNKPSTAPPNVRFFFDNEWYRLVYYAASPGALPGGPLACTLSTASAAKPPAPCPLGVDPLYQPLDLSCPGSPQPLPAACIARVRADGSREEAGVMLVLAGRRMLVGGAPQTRPTSVLADYLEDAKNLNSPVLSPREFEQKPRAPSFNDRVVVLAP